MEKVLYKSIIFSILLILPLSLLIAQREEDGTRSIFLLKLNRSTAALRYDLEKDAIYQPQESIILYAPKYLHHVETLSNGDFIVQVIDFDFSSIKWYSVNTMPSINVSTLSSNFYIIRKIDVENKTIKHYSTSLFMSKTQRTYFDGTSLSLGVVTIPFKLRFASTNTPFAFNPSISLGTTLGIKQRVSRSFPAYLNGIVYSGLSSVELNIHNSNPQIFTNANINRNEAAFTYAFGILYTVNKIQVGAIFGKDFISNQNIVQWIYHNKPWFAVGIGTQIFNLSK